MLLEFFGAQITTSFVLSLSGSRTTTILPQSFPPGLIAALVLVPLFAVIFIYLAVAVRRRYRQRKSGYVQQRSTYTEPDNPTA